VDIREETSKRKKMTRSMSEKNNENKDK